ncbi:MAG: CapA family protein [Blautia sp.]|nr:CapA family protein [Blautia sp.]
MNQTSYQSVNPVEEDQIASGISDPADAEPADLIDMQTISDHDAQDLALAQEPVTLKITVVGDCTLGTDDSFDYASSLNAFYYEYGPSYFLQNVKDIFSADDLTIANAESVFTESNDRADRIFAFKSPAEFAKIYTEGSVEAVNVANNHAHDYGDQGLEDKKAALDAEGVVHFGYSETAMMEIKGVKVGLVGTYILIDFWDCEDELRENIQKLKEEGADLIISIFHWGNELDLEPDEYQLAFGKMAVDAGADLVCGHHPHVIQGIETYKGKTIAYSLANFCFGGNVYPTDMDTFIFQQSFTIDENGAVPGEVNIIPCSCSSEYGYNNYQPTPATGEDAARIMRKLNERTSELPISENTTTTTYTYTES